MQWTKDKVLAANVRVKNLEHEEGKVWNILVSVKLVQYPLSNKC